MKIDNVEVTTNLTDLTDAEARRYIDFCNARTQNPVTKIEVTLCDDGKVDLYYEARAEVSFERIRRITGYLTGSLKSWNGAKQAEEHERVKHDWRRDYV